MLKRLLMRQIVRQSSTKSAPTPSTVDASEIQHFSTMAAEWWDEMGGLRALHTLNKLRVPLITDGLINTETIPVTLRDTSKPLQNVSILDVGCGGGILSEPLARLGASITGLDANADLIQSAKHHAEMQKLTNINYVSDTIEKFAETNANKYDAVVASEIVEHITEKEVFIKKCAECLKPNGSLFITTMSQTFLANVLGILMAEYVLRLVPTGTHDINKFIEPHKLQRILEDANCKTVLVHGMGYNPITNSWCWINDTSINYALHAVKLD